VAIERDGNTADQYLQLGHVLKLQERISEALDAYAHALALDPELSHARAELLALGLSDTDIEYRITKNERAYSVEFDVLANTPVNFPDDQPTKISIADPTFRVVELDTTRIAGWAYLPIDFHHTPLINIYRRGFLIAAGLANRTRPEGWTIGPKYNWFEICWEHWKVSLTEEDLASLIFQRGEDRVLADNPFARRKNNYRVDDLLEAEAFVGPKAGQVRSQLSNYSAKGLVHIYFLDYLGRLADPSALAVYQRSLEDGRLSVDDIRTILLRSDEFQRRRVRVSDRLGQVVGIRFLSLYPELAFDRLPPLRTYEPISASELMTEDDAEFLRRCHARIGGEEVAESPFLPGLQLSRMSRLDVLREMVLDAVSVGRWIRIDDLEFEHTRCRRHTPVARSFGGRRVKVLD
jgi:tetratricopeptide (TPR) repeat protein